MAPRHVTRTGLLEKGEQFQSKLVFGSRAVTISMTTRLRLPGKRQPYRRSEGSQLRERAGGSPVGS
jgi:hypothetical protein